MEEIKNELDTESSNDLNQLRIAVKQITQTLNLFMETTNKEIENIKKIIEQNHKMTNEESNEVKNIKFELNDRIQNLIIEQKEIKQKCEAVGSFVEGMIQDSPDRTMKSNESKVGIHNKYHERQPITKAILYDKYVQNKARVVTHSNNITKTYKISIRYNYYGKVFYINYQNKWIPIRYIINKLRGEGLVYGFTNIVKTLRERNKVRGSQHRKQRENTEDNKIKTDKVNRNQ